MPLLVTVTVLPSHDVVSSGFGRLALADVTLRNVSMTDAQSRVVVDAGDEASPLEVVDVDRRTLAVPPPLEPLEQAAAIKRNADASAARAKGVVGTDLVLRSGWRGGGSASPWCLLHL
jgi:hypothetical protein